MLDKCWYPSVRELPPRQRTFGRSGGSRSGSATALSGGHRRIESLARGRGTSFRGWRGSAALPDSQAEECEGVSAGELPEGLRPTDAQCLCDEQLHGGQSGVGENLSATRTDQSECGKKSRGGVGRDADRTSLGYWSGIAAKISDHQPDRIVFVDSATCGTKRKALARRKSAAALDRYRALGGGETIPPHQRLSRTLVAEGTLESFPYSTEGGANLRSRLNSLEGRFKVPNIESRCNQLKLGHPPD
jgi:hypothetical protein